MEQLFKDRKGLYAFTMLFILFVLMLVCLILSQAFVKVTLPLLFGITDSEAFIKDPLQQLSHPMALLYFQAVCSSIGFFLVPVLLFHSIFRYDMVSLMGIKALPAIKFWLLGIGIMLLAGVFIPCLVQLVSAIPLPATWQWLRSPQEQVDKMIEAFFSDPGMGRFVVLTLVVALLPAVAEEFCFRGTIQNTLAKTNLGMTGAIIVSGLTFSLVHFEFNNLLGIWCMGIVLGCLYYYSGSIWVNISAHFFNNWLVVIGKYAYMKGLIHSDVASNDTLPLYVSLPAGVVMTAGLVLMQKWRKERGRYILN